MAGSENEGAQPAAGDGRDGSPPDDRAAFSDDLGKRLSGVGLREFEKRSGWSKSTVGELRSGARLPSPVQLVDLLTVAAADEAEIADWSRRLERLTGTRTAAAEISGAEPANSDNQKDRRPLWKTRPVRVVFVGVAAAGLMAGSFVAGRWSARRPEVPVTAAGTPARIANTDGLGVSLYGAPTREGGAVGAIQEGAGIQIICQEGAGEPLTDRVDGRPLTWPVWDRLGDGLWVPDLYTSTSKTYTPGPGRTALMSC